jgi:hypothetical protein
MSAVVSPIREPLWKVGNLITRLQKTSVLPTERTLVYCLGAGVYIVAVAGLAFYVFCVAWTVWQGIGSWNLNRTIGWGWDITNFVWWVGIGHAGTLISAILLAVPSEMAYGGKPCSGGDDDLCRYLCGSVSRLFTWGVCGWPSLFSLIQTREDRCG